MHEIEQHVADIRVRVRAATIEDLFRDAMRGLFAVLSPVASAEARELHHSIAVDSIDRTSVLVDFLGDVLVAAHVGHADFRDVAFEKLSETEAIATVSGVAPVTFERDVKAVTYHEAEVQFLDGAWQTMLVLDI